MTITPDGTTRMERAIQFYAKQFPLVPEYPDRISLLSNTAAEFATLEVELATADLCKELNDLVHALKHLPPDCLGVGGDKSDTRWYVKDELVAHAKAVIRANRGD